MESYRNIYSQIKNPLENPHLFDIMIDYYSNNKTFYSAVTRIHKDEKKYSKTIEEDKEEFLIQNFNFWRENLLSVNDYELNKLKYIRKYNNLSLEDFRSLKMILVNIGKVRTIIELKEAVKNPIIRQYFPLSDELGKFIQYWIHVYSLEFTNYEENEVKTEHRLYLNIDAENLYKVVNLLSQKLFIKGLQFHFKYSPDAVRDDTIVIYTDRKHLKEIIEVLRELRIENPYLFMKMKKPPILTGIIDGWIGYGSESQNKNTSYNQVRSKILEKCIHEEYISYIIKNRNMMITYNNNEMTLQDYFSNLLTDKIMETISRILEGKNTQEEQDRVFKNYGLLPRDINDEQLRSRIYNSIRNELPKILEKIKNSSDNKVEIIIPTRNGKNISLDKYSIASVIKSYSKTIYKTDRSFINGVIRRIVLESIDKGIDPKKFCFDTSREKELFEFDNFNQFSGGSKK